MTPPKADVPRSLGRASSHRVRLNAPGSIGAWWLLAALVVLAPQTARSADRPEAAIRTARNAFNAAIRAHDAEAIGRMLLPSYLVVSGASAQVLGREANIANWEKRFRADPSVVYVRTPQTIRVNAAWGIAQETGEWRGVLRAEDGVSEPAGTYAAKWQRTSAGAWLLQVEVFTTLTCRGAAKGCAPPAPVAR